MTINTIADFHKYPEFQRWSLEEIKAKIDALLDYAKRHGITDPREAVEAYDREQQRFFGHLLNNPDAMREARDACRPLVWERCNTMHEVRESAHA